MAKCRDGRLPMPKTIRVPDFERNPRSVLDEVVRQGVPCVLTDESGPEVVLVRYQEFMKLQEAAALARFDEVWEKLDEHNANYSDEEIAADIEAARAELPLVPYDEFLKFQRLQEAEVLARFREVKAEMAERNAGFSDEEVERDVEATLAEPTG
jgi:PHD/YefM family antitoxin component YafN of YafNO toxin-antitoxin module